MTPDAVITKGETMNTDEIEQRDRTDFEVWWSTQNVTTDGVLERAFKEVAWKAWEAACYNELYRRYE